MKKLLLVDGNSLLFRAYYATSYGVMMRSKNGIYTNAIYAFSNMLNKILEDVEPEYALIAFDTNKKTFRHKKHSFYKANRKSTPEELVVQFPLSRELVTRMGLKVFEIDGYEADDIVATVAAMGEKNNLQVKIFSSDQDLLQLVSEKSSVHLIKKGIKIVDVVTLDVLKKDFQLTPKQVIEFKALSGDSSDNIPGVKGIGKVTALKLLEKYDNIDNIYAHIEEIKGKLKDRLIEDKEMAYISKDLATINREVPIDFTIEDLKYDGPTNELVEFYQRHDMNSLIKNIPLEEEKIKFEIVSDLSKQFLNSNISIYPCCSGENYHDCILNGVSFSSANKNYFVKIKDILKSENIKAYLGDDKFKKSTYDIKATTIIFSRYKIQVKGFDFDFKLATYLLDSDLKDNPYDIFASYGVNLPDLKNEENLEVFPVIISSKIVELKDKIILDMKDNEVYNLYVDIELPLVFVLIDMEKTGVKVDKEILQQLGVEYRFKLNLIETDIFSIIGHEFNVASPKQVGEVLFDELNLPTNKKRSTSVNELEKLVDKHPVINLILQHRKYSKLLSTYIDGLIVHIRKDDKIHAIFNQTQTQTGRLSSSDPNLQNISIRDEEARLIRKAFIPSTVDGEILSIDYSQVELRILASMANDEVMLLSFKNNEDIHTTTAMAIFDLPKDNITSDMRRQAKAVNFGIVYGISDWGLAVQTGTTPKEAKIFIEKYFNTYKGITAYLSNVVEECKKDGYVRTLFKRKRYVSEINHPSYMVREFGKRVAMNTPIQGTAADIIKIAMIQINKFLLKNNYKSKMIIQIHDELVFDMVKEEVKILTPLLKQIMEKVVTLKVTLKADIGCGINWFEAK